MALKKITEQATNDYPKKNAYVLVTQNDADGQGTIKESLRRVPAKQMLVLVDERDAKGYSVALTVTADGYPALSFTEIAD